MGIIKLKNSNEKQAVGNAALEEQQAYKLAVEAQVGAELPQEEQEQWDDPAVLHEDETRTDENSRHYVLNNGTAKSVFNAEPMSFFDEEEKKWKHIDNSLEEKEDAFESKSGKFKTRISKVHKGKKVAISKSDKQLSWEYLGKQVAAVANENIEDAAETVLKVNNVTQGVAKHINGSAVYENIEKDTDLEYCLHGNNLKENIIVKEKSTDYRYLFALKTEGLKLRLSDDNESLELYTEKEKEGGAVERKVEFTIPSPYMYDANGVASDDVYYELEPSEDGKFAFTVVANEEWINATDRAFPVTIDPQIVTSQNNLVTKQTYRRITCSNSSYCSGIDYGVWNADNRYSNIRVSKSSSYEYKTDLIIKKSLINLMEASISNVKLILKSVKNSGSFYCDNTSYHTSANGEVRLDITSKFKKSAGDFIVCLTPYQNNNYEIEFSMTNTPPVIEIEYLTNENVRPTKKTFTFAGIATGEVNLATGSMVTSICDVNPENSVMGMGIYHIHKRNADNYSLGGNFRLNLNEMLVKYADGDYIYTDSNGDKHAFHDYYYYSDNTGVKKYITNKSLIVVDSEGRMTYTENDQSYSVTCEYKSTTGLKAMTELEGIKNIEYFEQRSDELKEVEDRIKEYENTLKNYVVVDASGQRLQKNIEDLSIENYENFIAAFQCGNLLKANEVVQLKGLLKQKDLLESELDTQNVFPGIMSTQSQLIALRSALYEITQTLKKYCETKTLVFSLIESAGIIQLIQTMLGQSSCGPHLASIISALEKDEIVDLTSVEEVFLDKSFYKEYVNENVSEEVQAKIPEMNGYTLKQQFRQRNLYILQITEQEKELRIQKDNIGKQIDLILLDQQQKKESFQLYFELYLKACKEKENIDNIQPVNFLSNGKIIKGFNVFGDLVSIYDRYENYAIIEHESYYEGANEKRRIARVYDDTEKQVIFNYNEKNQLTAITDTRGRKTCFTYNINNVLTNIAYDTGENLTITYSGNNIYSLKETKNGLLTYIYYSYNRPIQISHYSTVDNIAVDGQTTGNKFISQVNISYNPYSSYPITATTVTENLVTERYYFDANGNCTGYRKADFDVASNQYLVSAAEQYTHNPYWVGSTQQSDPKEVVIGAARSSLNKTALDSYSFVNGDTEMTIIDQFNNPVSKTTSAILVAEWKDSNGAEQQNKQITTVSYVYDDNQKLVQETIVVSDSNPAKTVTSYKKYNYNAYGDVIRTESYVQGEEYTTGKTIEETVYDDKGNVIKSFTYNSLDTSSKFYTETEYDDNGKVTAELDETGENKTKFGYVDGTSTVREEVLPNGSKFAYGRDYDDMVTAISQSTEDGEENSTQKVRRCGVVVELKSGNNNVKYAYNHKRKLKAVELNGENERVEYNYTETKDSYGSGVKETVTATYKYGDITQDEFETEKDGKGNVLKITANSDIQIENVYDKKGQLDILKDKITDKNYKFERDELDNVTAVYEVDSSNMPVDDGYGEAYAYNSVGKLAKKTIVGSVPQEYTYGYKTDSTQALETITVNGSSVKLELDVLGRNKGKAICIGTDKIAEESIVYRKVGDHATNMPATIRFGNKVGENFALVDSLRYAYDAMGNIEKVYENGELAIRYQYDALNRLIREDNKVMNKTVLFSYDNNGNILKQRKFTFTLKNAIDIEELDSEDKVYIYDGDKLLAFNGEECAYNETTNVQTTYRGKTLGWTNRRVTSYNGVQFSYDGQGRRIAKGGISYIYDSQGRLLKQSNDLEFFYDHSGVSSVKHGENTYFYRKDILGNVIALLDTSGAVVVKYTYDAWGNNVVSNANNVIITDANHIGNLNPFRYRGYYYDIETKLYFLKTRYYDPEIGRFMTIDGIEYLNPETINGLNLYAYCGNNPIANIDPNGNFFITFLLVSIGIGAVVGGAIAGVTAYNNGARGWDLVGSIAGGAILGGGMGAIMAIGGAAGLASIGAGLTGFSLSAGAAFGVSVAVGAGAGLLSYTAETLISPSKQWSWEDFGKSAMAGTFKGAVTFGIAFAGGRFGAFDKVFLKDVLGKELVKDVFSYDIAKGILASIIPGAGRQFFTQGAYYLGESLTKMFFVNSIAAGARSIIDKIFGT